MVSTIKQAEDHTQMQSASDYLASSRLQYYIMLFVCHILYFSTPHFIIILTFRNQPQS